MLKDGMTYMHEHTTIDLSKVKNNEDCKLDVFPETVREFKSLYEKGVRNIVDVTNIGMGRNITYVQKVAKETGINIVFSTGFYQDSFTRSMCFVNRKKSWQKE